MVISVFHPHSFTSRMSPVREVIAATVIQTRPSRQSAGRFVVAILVCTREDKGWLQEPVWYHKEAVLHSVGLILVSESSVFNLYFAPHPLLEYSCAMLKNLYSPPTFPNHLKVKDLCLEERIFQMKATWLNLIDGSQQSGDYLLLILSPVLFS